MAESSGMSTAGKTSRRNSTNPERKSQSPLFSDHHLNLVSANTRIWLPSGRNSVISTPATQPRATLLCWPVPTPGKNFNISSRRSERSSTVGWGPGGVVLRRGHSVIDARTNISALAFGGPFIGSGVTCASSSEHASNQNIPMMFDSAITLRNLVFPAKGAQASLRECRDQEPALIRPESSERSGQCSGAGW